MRRPMPHRDLFRHAELIELLLLEGVDVEAVGGLQEMQVEVDQRRRNVFKGLASTIEVLRRHQLVDQRIRDRLAGAVMAREFLQHLGLLEPVLIKLRGQFDEVSEHAGA